MQEQVEKSKQPFNPCMSYSLAAISTYFTDKDTDKTRDKTRDNITDKDPLRGYVSQTGLQYMRLYI